MSITKSKNIELLYKSCLFTTDLDSKSSSGIISEKENINYTISGYRFTDL